MKLTIERANMQKLKKESENCGLYRTITEMEKNPTQGRLSKVTFNLSYERKVNYSLFSKFKKLFKKDLRVITTEFNQTAEVLFFFGKESAVQKMEMSIHQLPNFVHDEMKRVKKLTNPPMKVTSLENINDITKTKVDANNKAKTLDFLKKL